MSHITNIASRIFGVLANTKFPKTIQNYINRTYVKKLNLDMSDFYEPEYYDSLNQLFTRAFKTPKKFINDKKILYSMCDAWISECGKIDTLRALQIKGFSYSTYSLLGDFISRGEKDRLRDGVFVNFYLSPSDYHRYHSPCDMKITKAVHIPGELYPVNFKWLNKRASLFVTNERVVLECETSESSRFYLVFVGALNVGKIKFLFDERIDTNCSSTKPTLYTYEDLSVKQGDEIGRFEMGSTVVFLGEAGKFEITTEQDTKIKFLDNFAKII